MVAYSFGTLSISFSSVVSSLPYTSSVGLQERSSLEGESLRRIASTRRGWRCPCSGVRTDDWNWEQIRTFPSHMLAVFVKIRFSAGLWQRIVIPYGAVEFSRVVVVLVYSLPMCTSLFTGMFRGFFRPGAVISSPEGYAVVLESGYCSAPFV